MTGYKAPSALDKPFLAKNFEDILYKFEWPDGTCKTCGKSHRFKPKIEEISTSIEVIPLLLEKLRIWERFE